MGKDADILVQAYLLNLRQADGADLIDGIKSHADTTCIRVGCTVIPVVQTVPGGEVAVHNAPGAVAGIQGAVLHIARLMGYIEDTKARLSRVS